MDGCFPTGQNLITRNDIIIEFKFIPAAAKPGFDFVKWRVGRGINLIFAFGGNMLI